MSGAWIVGGALRDELLGRPVVDVDIAVAGDPAAAARELAAELRGPVFRLSEAFGAWRVIDRAGGRVFDFSPLQGDTIEEDLARRDFTINAMARPRAGGELIDPLGGRADVESRTLRVLGPGAYESDPLRALRLARFAAELGFAPDEETERLTREAAPRVAEASAERVFAELRRLVIADGVLAGLELADRLGLLRAVLPELADLHSVEQSHYHHLDVYDHTIEVLARLIELDAEARPELRAVLDEPLADELTRGQALRLGALLHDIGKPATHARARRRARDVHRPRPAGRRDDPVSSAGACERASACRSSSRGSPDITSCSASWSTSARSTGGPCFATSSARRRSRSR